MEKRIHLLEYRGWKGNLVVFHLKIKIKMKCFTFYWDFSDCLHFSLLKLSFTFLACHRKNCSWLGINEEDQSFSCWVCKLYFKVANENDAIYKGCKKWHRNYPTRRCDEKHKVRFYIFHSLLFQQLHFIKTYDLLQLK